MQADHAFTIGHSHKVCEDYARSGVTPPYSGCSTAYAFVSDGCSGSKDTDVGARILVSGVEQSLFAGRRVKATDDICAIIYSCVPVQRLLGLDEACLDATLLGVYVDTRINVFGMGDGVIAFKMHSGDLVAFDILSPSGFPLYPSYFLNRSRLIGVQEEMRQDPERGWRVDYIREKGDTIEREERCFWSRGLDLFVQSYSRGDEDPSCVDDDDFIETVAVFSDGVGSFVDENRQSVSQLDVVRELMAFKGYKGEFVKRRLQGFLRACAKRGWKHDDDLSMGAVYLG